MFHRFARSVVTLGFAGLLLVSASGMADARGYRLPPVVQHRAEVARQHHEFRMHHRVFRAEMRHERRCARLRHDFREMRREHYDTRHHGWM